MSFKEVEAKFGVTPDKVVDVLGLIGDTSDNVPGVPGIGEKTAIPLVQKYGSIEEIYRNLDAIPQKGVKTKLESNKDLAFLSKTLVTIDTKVPLSVDFHSLRAGKQDTEKLARMFEALEFKSLVNRLREQTGEVVPPQRPTEEAPPTDDVQLSDIKTDQHTYTLITSEKELKALAAKLVKSKEFVFDTETTSKDALNAELVGISVSMKPREAWYIPVAPGESSSSSDLFGHGKALPQNSGLPAQSVCSNLQPALEHTKSRKIGHNIKYDILVLSRYGINVQGELADTMVASYILRADARHNMDDAAKEYLQYKTVSYTDLTGEGKQQKPLREVALHDLSDYSCEDADITYRLFETMRPKLDEFGMLHLCEQVEFPLVAVLARMEQAGVAIDTDFLLGMSKDLDRQLTALT
ncbi:MAG TPA: 5'-3' exonuclease H3TH domain-containing protein, partial [Terriglobia bacterium]|nr:5'-3' exonuclease H3TH domain-containing protein [Terriglobia bacterium]